MDTHLTPSYNQGNHRHMSPTPQSNGSRNYRGLIHPSPIVNFENSNYGNSIHGNSDANPLKAFSGVTLPNRPVPRISNSFRNTDHLDSHSYDSGIGSRAQRTLLQGIGSPGMRVSENANIAQLPVRHTSLKGTQEGVLFPKYCLDVSSKCIMCKACGIFFSYDVFLCHLHDMYGKRVECQGQQIELATAVPSKEQILAFQEFLVKFGQNQQLGHMMESYQRLGSPMQNVKSKFVPKPKSPIVNKWTQDIQETVQASEKLLKETSEYLRTSATKLKHRRKNSLQLQELPFSSKGEVRVIKSSPTVEKRNDTVPIIKTHNPHRSSKKSLQNYFSSSQSSKKETNLQLPMKVTTTQQAVPSKHSSNHADANLDKETTIDLTSQHDASLKGHLTESLRVEPLDSQPSVSGHLTRSLHIESHNPKPSASGQVQEPTGVESKPAASGDAPSSGILRINGSGGGGATASERSGEIKICPR